MKKIAVIGYGRFGKLLAGILESDYLVSIIDKDKITDCPYIQIEMQDIANIDYIFIATPISSFEETVKELKPYVNDNHVIIDHCSVKTYPVRVMKEYFPDIQLIASHPMFGPDSYSDNLKKKVMMCNISARDDIFTEIKEFWTSKQVSVLEMTPEEHDKDSIYSQSLTYIIARFIKNMNIPEVTATTKSFRELMLIEQRSNNDTKQLFNDILGYNPNLDSLLAEMKQSLGLLEKEIEQVKRIG